MRIYELARQYKKSSQDIIVLLKKWGIPVKNHMSNVDDRAQFLIQEWLGEHENKAPVETATEKKEAPPLEKPPLPLQEKKEVKEEKQEQKKELPQEAEVRIFEVENPVPVRKIAELTEQSATSIIKELIAQGFMVTINQAVDIEIAKKIAEKHNVLLEEKGKKEVQARLLLPEKEDLELRPPVVSVMGHVDHGKTLLLDYIRKTKIVEKERGGITQHIGASSIEKDGRRIVFLDTPGHEAFTALRARGAQVTDIVVLVVAADDGVMPQTLEAIDHARAAKVPIIVAINKIDKEGANPEKVKRQLAEAHLIPESWGGDTITVEVSAKTGQNVSELLEMILLQSEVLELKTSCSGPALGTVIESKMKRNIGPTCTVLIQQGTLSTGDPVVAGSVAGKIRNIWNDRGEQIKKATPQDPIVEIIGLDDLPRAGDVLRAVSSEKEAREMARQAEEAKAARTRKITLERVQDLLQTEQIKEIRLICKADTQGSLEGLIQAIQKLEQASVSLPILHQGIGEITESDVLLASASSAIIIGFYVKCSHSVLKLAEQEGVQIRLYDIIYHAVEDIEKSIKGLLKEKTEILQLGLAEVKAVFPAPKFGKVAGCVITEGFAQRGVKFKVLRQGAEIGIFSLDSLRRFKEDVREVSSGKECGIGSFSFNEFQAGDILEIFTERKV